MNKLEVFYKPHQLINVRKEELNRVQLEGMNILLKKAQDILFYNYLLKTGEVKNEAQKILTPEELLMKEHYISVEDFIKSISQSVRIKDIAEVVDLLNDLSSIKLTTIDKNKYTFSNIFQRVTLNKTLKRIEFVLNNELTVSFSNGNSVLGESEVKVRYTPVPIYTEHMKALVFKDSKLEKFSDSEFALYEVIVRYIKYSKDNIFTDTKPFKINYSLEDFKALLGIKKEAYPKPSIFRSKILKPIEKTMSKVGININLNLLGRGVDANLIELVINKDSIVPEFLEEAMPPKDNKFKFNNTKEKLIFCQGAVPAVEKHRVNLSEEDQNYI